MLATTPPTESCRKTVVNLPETVKPDRKCGAELSNEAHGGNINTRLGFPRMYVCTTFPISLGEMFDFHVCVYQSVDC